MSMSYKYNINPLSLHKNYWGLERLGIILTPLRQIKFFNEELCILPDFVDNIISIDVDSNTNKDSGNLYITMKNHFVVVNMESKSIVDMYSLDSKGKSGDTLDKSEILNSDISK
jgi:hypothetical protein